MDEKQMNQLIEQIELGNYFFAKSRLKSIKHDINILNFNKNDLDFEKSNIIENFKESVTINENELTNFFLVFSKYVCDHKDEKIKELCKKIKNFKPAEVLWILSKNIYEISGGRIVLKEENVKFFYNFIDTGFTILKYKDRSYYKKLEVTLSNLIVTYNKNKEKFDFSDMLKAFSSYFFSFGVEILSFISTVLLFFSSVYYYQNLGLLSLKLISFLFVSTTLNLYFLYDNLFLEEIFNMFDNKFIINENLLNSKESSKLLEPPTFSEKLLETPTFSEKLLEPPTFSENFLEPPTFSEKLFEPPTFSEKLFEPPTFSENFLNLLEKFNKTEDIILENNIFTTKINLLYENSKEKCFNYLIFLGNKKILGVGYLFFFRRMFNEKLYSDINHLINIHFNLGNHEICFIFNKDIDIKNKKFIKNFDKFILGILNRIKFVKIKFSKGLIRKKYGYFKEFDIFLEKKSKSCYPKPKILELKGGKKISIVKGDLLREKVGAIVNPANSQLTNQGGISLQICQGGGSIINEECGAYLKKYSQLKVGEAFIGSAGALPADYIIHTVGPYYNNKNPKESEELLVKTIKSCLKVAEENKIETLSMPFISSGVFSYPLRDCVKITIETLQKELPELKNLKEVRIIHADITLIYNDIFPVIYEINNIIMKDTYYIYYDNIENYNNFMNFLNGN